MKALGLVGTNGAGKSTLCSYLKEKGYDVFSLSDVLRDRLRKEGIALTRDSMTDEANKIKETEGLSYLAEQAYEMAVKRGSDLVVFDSVRNVDEVTLLKDKGVVFIGVNAPIDVRYQRILSRQRESDFVDFDTFKRQDNRENTGESTGQNIQAALKECHSIVDNSGSYEKLVSDITIILQKDGFLCPD